MIVDSSAILAILRDEPDASAYSDALSEALSLRMSAATYLEAAIVIDADRNALLSRRLDDLVARTGVVIEPFTPEQARIARDAYRDFGRRSGHPEGRRPEGSHTCSRRFESGIVTADLRSALPTAVGLPLVVGSLRSG